MPSARAQRRSFKVMPIWMRSGDPATIFEGALREISEITFDAAMIDSASLARYMDREERMRWFADRLQTESERYEHILEMIFDGLDVAVRQGYEADAAERLLAEAIKLRDAIRAYDADEVYRISGSLRPTIRTLGHSGSA